jgi:hypothetical protein
MSDTGSAWKEAGDRFAALGASLKRHYDERAGSDPGAGGQDLGEAARRFARAVQDAADSLGAATRDPLVKEDARRVGTSLAEALSVTFAEVSEDLHRMAQDQPRSDDSTGPPGAPDGDGGTDDDTTRPSDRTGRTGPTEPTRTDEPWIEPWGTP